MVFEVSGDKKGVIMKLSTKGRYGARLMLDLALRYGQGSVFLKDIAARQGISEKYLGHLIPALKSAGLIHSTRGAHGGYMLAREPSAITLREIVQSTEGSLSLVECADVPDACQRTSECVTRDIWQKVTDGIVGVLEGITLEDMINMYREKQNKKPFMYSI